MAGGQNVYSDDEAEAILRIAVQRASPYGSLSREQLLASAFELGISEEAVLAAEQEYRAGVQESIDRKEFDKRVRHRFWGRFASYVIVNSGLVALDLVSNGKLDWAYWVVTLWGIRILFRAWSTFVKGSVDYQKEFGAWRTKRSRGESGVLDDEPSGLVIGVKVGESSRIRNTEVRAKKQQAVQHARERTGMSQSEAREAVEEHLEENQ